MAFVFSLLLLSAVLISTWVNDMGVGGWHKQKRDEPYRDDAYCETLALLADALLVLNQLVDERLKQNSLKKLKKNPIGS